MNLYRHVFYAKCPDNDLLIRYLLTVKSHQMINVFEIEKAVALLECGYHEDFADFLFARFGGHQKIEAHHHGFFIKTIRTDQGSLVS